MILRLALALAWQVQASPYADSATAVLIARARERHRQLDAAVRGYEATIRTRIDGSLGRGRFAHLTPLVAIEQESDLQWQAPNDVRIVTLGQRTATALPNARVNARWTKPWFIPRFLGDSIRLLDDDFPARAAIHPLAAGAEAYYRYGIVDSLELTLPGRAVRAVGVRVTPTGSDAALIAGEIWLDRETAETVRLSFVFVGRRLWAAPDSTTHRDTVRAEHQNQQLGRLLRVSADLEYGLFEDRFWLPFRQSLTLNLELPWFGNMVVPVNFITTFRNLRVNRGAPIAFTLPLSDTGSAERGSAATAEERRRQRREERERRRREPRDSLAAERRRGYATAGRWPGGRYEVVVPAESALRAYAWRDSLQLGLDAGDAQRLESLQKDLALTLERLPDSLIGRPRLTHVVEQLGDVGRYNRAEGHSLGRGYALRLGPPFLSAVARARYAFTDRRLQAALGIRRDAPGERSEVFAFREMRDADPLAPGFTLGNSFSAMFFAHDDGAYVFVEGGEVRHRRPWGLSADLSLGLRVARETAPRRLAHSGVNDFLGGEGVFQLNTPVVEGTFVTAGAEAEGGVPPLSWRAGIEVTAGDATRARGWLGATRNVELPLGFDATLSGWAGAGGGDSLPQRDFRLGGARSLRGFTAGALQGPSAWSFGVDLALTRLLVSPVVFADFGQTSTRDLAFHGRRSMSAGAGLSLLRGVVRVQAARPFVSGATWRFDLQFGARR